MLNPVKSPKAIVNKFAIILEWLRTGALKVEVLDADGVTVLYNWFTE